MHVHAATVAVLEGRIFHPLHPVISGQPLTDRLFSEKTFNRQHAQQQRDTKSFAGMVHEVTHDDLLLWRMKGIVTHFFTYRK